MENAAKFREKLQRGIICIGAAITFRDPTVSEALASVLDFVWVDGEHGPLTIESIMGHIMATKGTDAAPIVRASAHFYNSEEDVDRFITALAANLKRGKRTTDTADQRDPAAS